MADADFAVGDLVLRERFLLRGPAELPPLGMFRPVPPEVGTVEILGEETGESAKLHRHVVCNQS